MKVEKRKNVVLIGLKKRMIPKWLRGVVSIDEIEKDRIDKSMIDILVCGLVIIGLMLLVFLGYYLYCVLRINPVINNEFEMIHIGYNVQLMHVMSYVARYMESVVIKSIMIID